MRRLCADSSTGLLPHVRSRPLASTDHRIAGDQAADATAPETIRGGDPVGEAAMSANGPGPEVLIWSDYI
jgi:hypothetical protein